jgi:hypothetical protein
MPVEPPRGLGVGQSAGRIDTELVEHRSEILPCLR